MAYQNIKYLNTTYIYITGVVFHPLTYPNQPEALSSQSSSCFPFPGFGDILDAFSSPHFGIHPKVGPKSPVF